MHDPVEPEGIPVFITSAMQVELVKMGYHQAEIDAMAPEEAWRLIRERKGTPEPKAEEPSRAGVTKLGSSDPTRLVYDSGPDTEAATQEPPQGPPPLPPLVTEDDEEPSRASRIREKLDEVPEFLATPLTQALRDLGTKIDSLGQKIENKHPLEEPASAELGGALGGLTQRDALEIAKRKAGEEWEEFSLKERRARTIAELAELKAETFGQSPVERKLRALEKQGVDPDIIARGREGFERLHKLTAQQEKEEAQEGIFQQRLGLFAHITGLGGLASVIGRFHEIGRQKEKLSRAEDILARPSQVQEELADRGARREKSEEEFSQDLSGSGRDFQEVKQEAKEAARSEAGWEQEDDFSELGGGAEFKEAAGNELRELIRAIRELTDAMKGQGSVASGTPRQPGPQPSGEFIPAGPTPMREQQPAQQGSRSLREAETFEPPGRRAMERDLVAG